MRMSEVKTDETIEGTEDDSVNTEIEERVLAARPSKPKLIRKRPGCCLWITTHICFQFVLTIVVVLYSFMGGFLFQIIESRDNIITGADVILYRNACTAQLMNLTQTVFNKTDWFISADVILDKFQDHIYTAVRDGYWYGQELAEESDEIKMWSFAHSTLFSVALITTLGYGNITPNTDIGKLVTILYAVVGIPLFILFLSSIGKAFAVGFRCLYIVTAEKLSYAKRSIVPGLAIVHRLPNEPMRIPMFVSLAILFGYILVGALILSNWEKDWDFLSAAYFCFITVSTIGLGDYVFGASRIDEHDSTEKLVFTCVYLILGLAVVAMTFDLIQDEVRVKVRNLGMRLGLI